MNYLGIKRSPTYREFARIELASGGRTLWGSMVDSMPRMRDAGVVGMVSPIVEAVSLILSQKCSFRKGHMARWSCDSGSVCTPGIGRCGCPIDYHCCWQPIGCGV